MSDRERPYVICHMVPSVDGRIVTTRWDAPRTLHSEYESTAASFAADAWMIGRVSMEPYAGRARLAARGADQPARTTSRNVQRRRERTAPRQRR